MGAWSSGPFHNDTAADWVDSLCTKEDATQIRETLETVSRSGTEDADYCQIAVAAAEVLSALRGHPPRGCSDELKKWVSYLPDPGDAELLSLAKTIVRSILQESELKDLWESDPKWISKMEDLLERLDRSAKERRVKKKRKPVPVTNGPKNPTQAVRYLKQLGFDGLDIAYENRRPNDVLIYGAEKLRDEDLRVLPVMQDLEYVSLYDCFRVTDVGLAYIAQLPRLKSLLLKGASLTDAGVSCLTELKHLDSLRLTDMKIGDQAMQHIQQLTGLTYLELSRTNITDAACSMLLPLTNLEMLDLRATQVTSAGIEQLKQLPNLKDLRLVGTKVDDDVLAHLLEFPRLKDVSVIGTKVSREAVKRCRAARPQLKIFYG